jgi:hypothetical protein
MQAGLFSPKVPDDIIEAKYVRGGRVESENEIIVCRGESIGEGKDKIFIGGANSKL